MMYPLLEKERLIVDMENLCDKAADTLAQLFVGYPYPDLDDDTKWTIAARSIKSCLLYTSPSPRDQRGSRMPSSA